MTTVRTFLVVLALAGGAAGLPAAPVSAQDVEYLSSNRDWHAFQFTEGGNKVCYMASRPTSQEGQYTRRGDAFVLVTHRPSENSRNVVSVIAGYTYQPNSEVTMTIGSENFTLFTEQDTAWARDAATDQRLIQAMQRGASMTVRGTSSRGTRTTDTYSLLGFSATHQEINRACNL